MLSFQQVNESTWPFLRGVSALSNLFGGSTCPVDNVVVRPGHVAVLLKKRTTLALFDAVVEASQLTAAQSAQLTRCIEGSDKDRLPQCLVHRHSAPVIEVTMVQSSYLRLLTMQEDGLISMWEWSPATTLWAPLAPVNVRALVPTRPAFPVPMVVSKAHFTARPSLVTWMEAPAGAPADARLGQIFYSVRLVFPDERPAENGGSLSTAMQGNDARGAPVELQGLRTLPVRAEDVGAWYPARDGVWMSTPEGLVHVPHAHNATATLPIRSSNAATGSAAPDAKAAAGSGGVGPVSAVTVHPMTQELVVLEASGRVLVVVPAAPGSSLRPLAAMRDGDGGRLEVRKVCQLPGWNGGAVGLVAYRTMLCLFGGSECHVHSLQNGKRVATLPIPGGGGVAVRGWWQHGAANWRSGMPTDYRAGAIGMWSAQGVWQLRQARVAELINGAAAASTDKATASLQAAELCRYWDLDRWAAKHLLDHAFNAKEEREIDVSPETVQRLAASLQNPGLVLALLTHPSRHKLSASVLHDFVDAYNGVKTGAQRDVETERVAARRSFLVHTNLNASVVGPLRSLDTMTRTTTSGAVVGVKADVQTLASPLAVDYPHLAEGATLAQLQAMTRADLDAWIRYDPKLVLQTLVELYKTKDAPSNALVHGEEALSTMAMEGRSKNHRVFEILCRLFNAYDPLELPRFLKNIDGMVSKVDARAWVPRHLAAGKSQASVFSTEMQSNSPVDRALNALPPILGPPRVGSAAQAYPPADEDTIAARVSVLCQCGRDEDALRLLIQHGAWPATLEFVRSRADQDQAHSELFQTLLVAVLRRGDTERLTSIWPLMPTSYSLFELLALLEEHCSPEAAHGVLVPAGTARINVGSMRAQLLAMFEKQGFTA